MAFEFHGDIALQFDFIYTTAREHILPFVDAQRPLPHGARVLDIGCGTGGVLKAFAERGCTGVGVDLWDRSIGIANQNLHDFVETGQLEFRVQDVYDYRPEEGFDLVVFKDAIEHIPHQQRILAEVLRLLKPGGRVWLGFPPWAMPYGGHQQVLPRKFWALLPWYHLLPKKAYAQCLRWGGASPRVEAYLLEVKDLGLSTLRFERLAAAAGYRVAKRKLWFVQPAYAPKFKLRPMGQWGILGAVPGLRDVLSTAAYYVLEPATPRQPA